MVVGRLLSFVGWLIFRGELLNFGRVYNCVSFHVVHQMFTTSLLSEVFLLPIGQDEHLWN